MLPEPVRLHRSRDFTEVVRSGRRAGRSTLVVHLLAPVPDGSAPGDRQSKVGFIVSRQVGNSVRRHEVTRRLRHLMLDRIGLLPDGSRLVVRAKPAAAGSTSAQLGHDLDGSLARLRTGSGR
ncbi:MAG TPA: ribonuclease P protein component [Mycobacteriales bacterium]|jgi:ribonuclease P protein component|nr:ribonuclease P protein component [Mycobacteriales bacterium]